MCDDRGHSSTRKMVLPLLDFTTENDLSYIIRGVTICHNLPKQWSVLGTVLIKENKEEGKKKVALTSVV